MKKHDENKNEFTSTTILTKLFFSSVSFLSTVAAESLSLSLWPMVVAKIKWEPPKPLSYAKHILRKLRDTNKGHAMPYNTKIWRKLRVKSGWSNRRVERDQADVWNEGRSKHRGKGAEGEKRKLFETHKLYWWLKIFDAWQLSRNRTHWTYFPLFTQMLDFKHKLISFFRDYLVD